MYHFNKCYLLLPTTKLWQGNVFTPVCHSVHGGGHVCLVGDVGHVWHTCPPAPSPFHACPLPCMPPATHAPCHACPAAMHTPTMHTRDAVNERAVRILLECILVIQILVNDLYGTKELIGWTGLHLLLFSDWSCTCQSEISQSINVSRIAQTVRSSHHLDRTSEG